MTGAGRAIAAGLLLVARAPAGARAETPAAFLQRLYAPYVAGETVHTSFADGVDAFVPGFWPDAPAADDRPGPLDGDPFCDFQDFTRLRGFSVQTGPVRNGTAMATVRFVNDPYVETVGFSLQEVGGRWRIADTASDGDASLRARLRDHPSSENKLPPLPRAPDAFLRALYAPYGRLPPVAVAARRDVADVFAAPLATSWGRDPGPARDPFCHCRVFTRLTGLAIAWRGSRATVRFREDGRAVRLRVRLARVGAGWRVAAIESAR